MRLDAIALSEGLKPFHMQEVSITNRSGKMVYSGAYPDSYTDAEHAKALDRLAGDMGIAPLVRLGPGGDFTKDITLGIPGDER